MPEASEFETVITVFSFSELLLTFFVFKQKVWGTIALTEFVDISNFVFRWHRYFGWTEELKELIERCIKSLKKKQDLRWESKKDQDCSRKTNMRLITYVKKS